MPALAVLAGLLLLLAYLISRATWRPGTPVHAARRRAWGQILTAAARSYRRRPSVYVGIGLIFIPISLAITALQAGVFALLNATSAQDESTIASLAVFVMLAVGTTLTLLGLGLVQAATLQALLADDAGRRIGLVEACRLAAARLGTLVRALLVAVLVVSLLAASIFALPFAVWLAVRWALVVPVIELERVSALGALRRSRELVRGRWLKVGSLIVVGAGLALLAGPLLAGVLIILTDTPLSLLNLLAALVYALTMPFVALVTAFVYLDARVRHELAPPAVPTLPAEIDLAAAGRTTA
jgi:hypothetical protein